MSSKPPCLVRTFIARHAAHYTSKAPAAGHDLEVWIVEYPTIPSREQVRELGVADDAEFTCGFLTNGVQTWHYIARRPLSPGTCFSCS